MAVPQMFVQHQPDQHRFVIRLPEGHALVDYRLAEPKIMEMYHTFVPSTVRGRGIASKLVTGALEYARSNGFKIIPACWYVAAFVESHPEFNDVVADNDGSARAPACEL